MSTSFNLNDQNYVLTFNDEFDGDRLRLQNAETNDGIWATTFSPGWDDLHFLSQNNEQQYYVDPNRDTLISPFTMGGGKVQIKATPLTAQEQALAQGQAFSSGLLTSEMTFSADAGYVEMRADLPDQQGFWNAFWMLPSDGGWSSEIDIVEQLGQDPDTLHTNVWDHGSSNELAVTVDGSDGFHTYGLLWAENLIQWYYDGELIREVEQGLAEEMFLALGLAIGGFAGDTDETTDFSDTMVVDYVRVYELENDPNRNEAIGEDGYVPPEEDVGTNRAEMMRGTMFDDVINAGTGRDKVYGREGDDLISGEIGNDRLFGGADSDVLDGGDGHDRLFGGYGSDTLDGGKGTDRLFGFEGADLMHGGRGYDRLFGEKGDDTLYGQQQRDDLFGGQGDDSLFGGMGTDELYGNKDDDALFGGSGADKLVGGYGSDTLTGDGGADHLWGGTYNGDGVTDRFVFDAGCGKDTVHDFDAGTDLIDLSDMNATWDRIEAVLETTSWGTRLDLSEFGNAGDEVWLMGVDKDALTATDFDLTIPEA